MTSVGLRITMIDCPIPSKIFDNDDDQITIATISSLGSQVDGTDSLPVNSLSTVNTIDQSGHFASSCSFWKRERSCPQRTYSDCTWYSSSDDEEEEEDDEEDLLPAIRRSILACESCDSDDSTSTTATVLSTPTSSPFSLRQRLSSDDLSSIQSIHDVYFSLPYLVESSRSDTIVQFSTEPPQVYCYERPEEDDYCHLYYAPHEMEELLNDYLAEQEHEEAQLCS